MSDSRDNGDKPIQIFLCMYTSVPKEDLFFNIIFMIIFLDTKRVISWVNLVSECESCFTTELDNYVDKFPPYWVNNHLIAQFVKCMRAFLSVLNVSKHPKNTAKGKQTKTRIESGSYFAVTLPVMYIFTIFSSSRLVQSQLYESESQNDTMGYF